MTGETYQFSRYAIASLAEAGVHLRNGVGRGYWTAADCRVAHELGERCDRVIKVFLRSLEPDLNKPIAHSRTRRR